MWGRNINVLKGILYCFCYLWYMNYLDIAILKLRWKKEKSLIKHKGQWISICFICLHLCLMCRDCGGLQVMMVSPVYQVSLVSQGLQVIPPIQEWVKYKHFLLCTCTYFLWLQWANSSASPAGHRCTDGFRVRWQIRTSGNAEWLKGERPAAITTD